MQRSLLFAAALLLIAVSVSATPTWNRELIAGTSYAGLTAQPVSTDYADQAQLVTAVLASGALYGGGVSDPITDLNNGTGAKTGNGVLGDDFPGNGNSDIWVDFDLGSPETVGGIHVFTQNADARVFQHYNVLYSADGISYTPLIEVIGSTERTFPTADSNAAAATCLTAVWDDTTGVLFNAQYVRLQFYGVGNTLGAFVDQYDAADPNDADGGGNGVNAAAQSTVLTEIDILNATTVPVELSTFSTD
jgi:hypothetical protein